METIGQTRDLCDALTERQDAAARALLGFIAGKWPLWVLTELAAERSLRFSRLQGRVEGISQKMLTQTLRQLERAGLVVRTAYPEVPPRVEYALTALGAELLAKVLPVWTWVMERIEAFDAAQRAFDLRQSA